MKKEALAGRIYPGFMFQWFHCLLSNHPHSCLVRGRLIELLFQLLISFQRVLQIFVLNKLNKCADTYDIPALCKLETVTVLSSTQINSQLQVTLSKLNVIVVVSSFNVGFLKFCLCLKGQCHEDFAVLGQFCAKIITLRL